MQPTTTSLRFASATSTVEQTQRALGQAVDALRRQLAGATDLVVFFATPHHAGGFPLIYDFLNQALGPRVILGVTGEGVIGVRREIEQQPGLSVLAATMPGAALTPFSYEQIDWPAVIDSPQELRETIHTGDAPLRAILMLGDPFSTPMVKLLPAINQCFPGIPVIGGMASGSRQPRGNRLLLNGQVLREGAIGLAIGGDIRVDCTVSQGCRPIGRPMVITRSKRHLVQELGGRKALQALQEMVLELGEQEQSLARSGLLVGRVIDEYKERFGRGDFLIRGLIGFDPDAGYIAIGDPQVRVGQTIQFQVRDRKTAEEDFRMLLQTQQLHGEAAGALIFSCNARGQRLFDRANADAEMIHGALGDVPLAGFFAAGEIGPIGQENFIHGHTVSLVVFREGQ